MKKVKKTSEAVMFAELLGVSFSELSATVIRGLMKLDLINNEGLTIGDKLSELSHVLNPIDIVMNFVIGRSREDYKEYFKNLEIIENGD